MRDGLSPPWRTRASVAIVAIAITVMAWQAVRWVDGSAAVATTKPESSPVRDTAAERWGSYEKLFAANSPWNSRPVGPVLGNDGVPKSDYYPAVAEGAWSTGVFLTKDGDAPVTVFGKPGTSGVWDPDAGQSHEITIPHWPEAVEPAIASDGHAEIVDPTLGVVHSFWQLKKLDGRWTAVLYAWSPLAGRGWGDPAHFYQGARAAAVPSSGGLIRKHEVNDGDTMYRHALAMSLNFNGLAARPAYVFPATSADEDAITTNSGKIPEGALLMLPSSFDTRLIETPALRKIAETLKAYGAYAVDRNLGTPYSIYVEIGSGFELHRRGWNNPAANDLELIRQNLHPVVSESGWLDGDGKPFIPEHDFNLLSMRGPWRMASGSAPGRFDSWKQSVVFDAVPDAPTVLVNDSGRAVQPPSWAMPTAGASYRVTAMTTGGAKLRVRLRAKGDPEQVLFDSHELKDGQSITFPWPADCIVVTEAISGVGGPSTVRGEIVAQVP